MYRLLIGFHQGVGPVQLAIAFLMVFRREPFPFQSLFVVMVAAILILKSVWHFSDFTKRKASQEARGRLKSYFGWLFVFAIARLFVAQPCLEEWTQYQAESESQTNSQKIDGIDEKSETKKQRRADALSKLVQAILIDWLACAYGMITNTPFWAYGGSIIAACCFRPVDDPEHPS